MAHKLDNSKHYYIDNVYVDNHYIMHFLVECILNNEVIWEVFNID